MKSTTAAERQVTELFRDLVAGLPSGTASLKIETQPGSISKGTRLEVIPSRDEAAKIVATVLDRGMIFLTFGRAASFEFQIEGAVSPNGPPIEEIEALSKAVIEGKFEEDLWIVGSQVFKGTGKIMLPSGVRTTHYRGSFHPLEKTEKQHVMYLPYRAAGA